MQEAAAATFDRLIPIATGADFSQPFESHPSAALEAVVFFRGRLAPFDFAVRNATDKGGGRLESFVDSAARATEHFAAEVGESAPDYHDTAGLEKAFAVRQHIRARLLQLGPLVFPTPQKIEKANSGEFYDQAVVPQAGRALKDQVEAITPLQSFWLYGSALQTQRLPGDLDFKVVTKAPLNFEQYAALMRIRMDVVLDGQTRPAAFAVTDLPTWQSVYPLDETFWKESTAWNFGEDNQVFHHPEAQTIQVKAKLMQEMINLYRMVKKLDVPTERPEVIRLATDIPDILKARIRNVNILATCLQKLGVEALAPDYHFAPHGSVEAKLTAAKFELYRLAALVPADL